MSTYEPVLLARIHKEQSHTLDSYLADGGTKASKRRSV